VAEREVVLHRLSYLSTIAYLEDLGAALRVGT
jgi:hypothetical protein